MSSFQLSPARGTLLAATALGFVLAACVGVPQAQAQFVCVGNLDGATVGPATASGAGATATGGATNNVACGTSANAGGVSGNNTATGNSANASGDFSRNTATGFLANASGAESNNTATGFSANASGNSNSRNTATGVLANASGDGGRNIAIGSNANASGVFTNNTAVGSDSTATGLNSSAFGNRASATFANSAAFGNGATATSANQQMFGTATNTYTMPGITSAASRSAQSGATQIVTSDSGGNLATSTPAGLGLASSADIGGINARLGGINARLDDLTTRSNNAFTGVAMAFAMAGVPTLMPNEKFAITTNWGTFQGANGLALNAAVKITDNMQLNGGIGYGPDQRIAGGRAGLRFGW
jgi:trimeric autotransporter adhesin